MRRTILAALVLLVLGALAGYGQEQKFAILGDFRLESGEILRCFVIDLSRGGAALSCQHAPQLGEKMVLGTVACHVVRKLAVGFAVQFETPQEPDGLEQLAAGFEPTA